MKLLHTLLLAIVLLSCALSAVGQQLSLSTASPVYPGATLIVAVNMTGSAGSNVGTMNFTVPAGTAAVTAGSASAAATKTLNYANSIVLLSGFNNSGTVSVSNLAYNDGVVATFSYVVPVSAVFSTPLNLALTNIWGANTLGQAIAMTTSPLTLTVGVNPACISVLTSEISPLLTAPTQALVNKFEQNIVAALTGGVCQ